MTPFPTTLMRQFRKTKSKTMTRRRVESFAPTLMTFLLSVNIAVAQTRSDAQGRPDEAPAPHAHDSDLDPLLVNGARTPDLPLLTQPILDTPQTVTAISEEVMQLQAASDLRDVLRNDPSVSAHADEDNAQGTNVQIRGFSARYDMYLDGQLDFGSYYRDPFNLEEVEVLTGPSSVLFGRGSTGGAIEQITKKPRMDEFADGTVSLGSDRLKRVTADVNVPVQDGAAFRMAGMAQDGGTAGRDIVRTRRVGVAPSFSVGMSSATQLTISYLYQRQWDRPDYGVPWVDIGPATNVSQPAPVPPDNFYGFQSDFSRVSVNLLTAALRTQLADNITLRNQIRYGIYDQDYREAEPGIGPVIAPGTPLSAITVTRTERGGRAHQSFFDDQLSVTADVETFGLKHTVVAGAEAGRQVSDPTVLKFAGVPGTNLIAPNEDQDFSGTSKPSSIVRFVANTQALFATDTVLLGEHWELNGAARLDRFDADYRNQVPSLVTLEHTDVIASWRGAIIYKPMHSVSVYGMYGTSFDPSAEGLSLSASTANLAPERSHTVETGIKWDPNNYLLLSGAVFRTVMSNLREASPTDPTVQILAGTARSQGIELQAQGYVTRNWLVLAGFTYLDASILSSPNGDRGSPLQNAPRDILRLFSTYDISTRLTIGGGVDYTSSRVPGTVVDANGFRQEVPGYWSASALARYRIASRINLQLNVDNIANRRFYDGLDDNHVNLGAGRSVRISFIVQK
jgi:catecholate siderophore receptor